MKLKCRDSNNIILHIIPRKTVEWDDFKRDFKPFSVALDWFVRWKPRFTEKWPYANFNHHEHVDRLATRSTCAQVLLAIRQGLLETFSKNERPKINIWVNDCDLDTALAVWILKNYRTNASKRLDFYIDRLVYNEDFLDVTGWTYNKISSGSISFIQEDIPFLIWSGNRDEIVDTHIMEYLSRISEPYDYYRYNWKLNTLKPYQMRGVINETGNRITKYIKWVWEKKQLDSSYKIIWWWNIKWKKKWYMIREFWANARQVFFRDGINAFVSVRDNLDGTYTYTLWKVSQFIYFPILWLYDRLNEEDWIPANQIDRWWWSDIIWWSPRNKNTKIPPEKVEEIINKYIKSVNLQKD